MIPYVFRNNSQMNYLRAIREESWKSFPVVELGETSCRIDINTTCWLLYMTDSELASLCFCNICIRLINSRVFCHFLKHHHMGNVTDPLPILSMMQSKLSTQNTVGTPPLSWGIRGSTWDFQHLIYSRLSAFSACAALFHTLVHMTLS